MHSVQDAKPAELIVIDNGSTDPSIEILRRHSGITLIENRENLGFGRAANQGFERSNSPYVLLLNVDTQALPGSIEALEAYLEKNPSAAIAAPQLLFPDGRLQPSCRRLPTVMNLALYLSYLDRLIPTDYRISDRRHKSLMRVEQPMGAVLMIRKSAFEQLGAFDPRFSLYMEEVDLCKRMKDKGWEIWYLPEAKFIHHAGGSTSQDWERSQRAYFENVFRYFEKHSPDSGVRMLRIVLPPALLLRALVLLVRGRFRQARFYFKQAFRI